MKNEKYFFAISCAAASAVAFIGSMAENCFLKFALIGAMTMVAIISAFAALDYIINFED